MSGAGGVATLLLLEWTIGGIAAAAWTQSWSVVRRGHFKIIAWCVILLAVFALAANRAATMNLGTKASPQPAVVVAFLVAALVYLLLQYSRTDVPGTVAGAVAGVVGGAVLVLTADLIPGWPHALAAVELLAGALLLGAVSNGMLLGHWYLNQPGLKPWALGRLTDLALASVAVSAVLGLVASARLLAASVEQAGLFPPGFGASLADIVFGAWLVLLVFTGVVLVAARRCVKLRSIQSATGLLYVAILTAGVSEFLVRYLMVNVR